LELQHHALHRQRILRIRVLNRTWNFWRFECLTSQLGMALFPLGLFSVALSGFEGAPFAPGNLQPSTFWERGGRAKSGGVL